MLSNFTDIFKSEQVSGISSFIIYLFLIVILGQAFTYIVQVANETIENIIVFVKLFVPTYFVAVGTSTGVTTASVYYEIILVITYFVESFFMNALIPMICTYMIIGLLNGLLLEERLVLFLELLKKGINLTLKIFLGAVTGISLIQSALSPVIDSLRNSTVKKALSAIPGIGSIAEGAAELVLGSAILLKNSLGILMLILLIYLCLVPILKIAIIAITMKLGAAFVGMLGDKRVTDCTNLVGDAGVLLLRTIFSSLAVFIIVIAVITKTTG